MSGRCSPRPTSASVLHASNPSETSSSRPGPTAFQSSRPRRKAPAGLIEHGESGLLASVDDAGALADAIRRVLGDRDMAARLARAGRAVHETRFTESAVTGKYLDLFERLTVDKDAT